jgi:hypothetical protein
MTTSEKPPLKPPVKSMSGGSLPRTPTKAWAEHERRVKEEAQKSGKSYLLIMLEHQRLDYEAGRFPWAWPPVPWATKDQIKAAIAKCTENGERPLGRRRMIPAVQQELVGYRIRQQTVIELMPKAPKGRPAPRGH